VDGRNESQAESGGRGVEEAAEMSDTINVLPVDDIEPHIENEQCPCMPSVERHEDGRIIIHNSFDGREYKSQ